MSRHRHARMGLTLMAAAALLVATAPAAFAQAPSNDDFDSATVIATLAFSDSVDTTEATTASDDPDCAGNGHTVWYVFTASAGMTIAANTFGSDYDTTLSVYAGTRGALDQIACNDDSGSLQSRVSFSAASGTSYFLMVGSFFDSPGGQLELSVAELLPPPNDGFADATAITDLPFNDHADTDLATSEADDPNCNGNEHSVWYRFTPSAAMELQADTFGSDYETTVSAWTGTSGHLSKVACGSFRIRFNAASGTTYYFMVGAAPGSPGGGLTFNLKHLPPLLKLGMTVDPTGGVTRAGAATIHGGLTCSREASGVQIIGTIRQQIGKKVTVSSFAVTLDCVDAVTWSATVAGETGVFRKGTARVTVSTSYFDEAREENVSARASQTVQLQ